MKTLPMLLAAHDIALAVVFGSRARGAARPDSDLDLGVLHRDQRPLSFRELAALAHALEAWRVEARGIAFGSRAEAYTDIPEPMREGAFDLADLSSPDALFRFGVAQDAIVVHVDAPSRWVEWLTRTLIDYDDIAYHLPMLIAGVERAARAASP